MHCYSYSRAPEVPRCRRPATRGSRSRTDAPLSTCLSAAASRPCADAPSPAVGGTQVRGEQQGEPLRCAAAVSEAVAAAATVVAIADESDDSTLRCGPAAWTRRERHRLGSNENCDRRGSRAADGHASAVRAVRHEKLGAALPHRIFFLIFIYENQLKYF